MKFRRLFLYFGLIVAALFLGCLGYTFSLPKPNRQITDENFARIQMGMSEAEVNSILGGPAGDYLTAPEPMDSDFQLFAKRFKDLSPKHRRWKGDELCIFIDFDQNGGVSVKHCLYSSPRPANLFQHLRRWFPW